MSSFHNKELESVVAFDLVKKPKEQNVFLFLVLLLLACGGFPAVWIHFDLEKYFVNPNGVYVVCSAITILLGLALLILYLTKAGKRPRFPDDSEG